MDNRQMLRALVLSSRLAARRLVLPPTSRSVAHPCAPLTRGHAHTHAHFSPRPLQSRPLSSSADGSESFSFQAETKQLLDIVARSLMYSDKEVFIREIVSNASDALEKLRLADLQQGADPSGSALQISVTCDDAARTLTVTDTGIGMSKEELVQCLGTIASSGTRSLVEKLKSQGSDSPTSLIGKFGVGFYSVFMTCDSVRVTTRRRDASTGYVWSSDGSGTYSIKEAADAAAGTSVCMVLREDCAAFAQKEEVQRVLLKYSNFINFPVHLDGARINTIDAIWTKDKQSISDDDHLKFFQFIADTSDAPAARLHFTADAPIDIRALLYVPATMDDMFQSEEDSKVALYARRVLIQRNCSSVLPPFLRFVRGVVDCADIPLSISREHMQDSALIARIKTVMTNRVLRWLQDEAKKEDGKAYNSVLWPLIGRYVKEGLVMAPHLTHDLAPLLRYESSNLEEGQLTSLAEYTSRMKDGQTELYVLCCPTRALCEASPYVESFKRAQVEVLYTFTPFDELVHSRMPDFNGKQMKLIDHAALPDSLAPKREESGASLGEDAVKELCAFLKTSLGARVLDVSATSRLFDSPCAVAGHENAGARQMRKMFMARAGGGAAAMQTPPVSMLINPHHPTVVALSSLFKCSPDDAGSVAKLMLCNAQLSVGNLDDIKQLQDEIQSVVAICTQQHTALRK